VVRGMDAVVQRHGCGGAEAWMRWCRGMDAVVRGMDVVVQRHGCGGSMDERHGCGGAEAWDAERCLKWCCVGTIADTCFCQSAAMKGQGDTCMYSCDYCTYSWHSYVLLVFNAVHTDVQMCRPR